jgi:hypothetical protein
MVVAAILQFCTTKAQENTIVMEDVLDFILSVISYNKITISTAKTSSKPFKPAKLLEFLNTRTMPLLSNYFKHDCSCQNKVAIILMQNNKQ